MMEHPLGFGHWLGVADRLVFGAVQVALIDGDAPTRALADTLRRMYVPTLVLARECGADDAPALVRERRSVNGDATAYVCRESTCELPTTDVGEMARQLRHAVRQTH